MDERGSPDESRSIRAPSRRAYRPPRLADYGHVAERTLANMKGSINDMVFPNAKP